jgi:hypothetical protein
MGPETEPKPTPRPEPRHPQVPWHPTPPKPFRDGLIKETGNIIKK